MNKTLTTTLMVLTILVLAAALLFGGFMWGRSFLFRGAYPMGSGMMGGYNYPDNGDGFSPRGSMHGYQYNDSYQDCTGYGGGMHRGGTYGGGMHGGDWMHNKSWGQNGNNGCAYGNKNSWDSNAEPLTIEQAHQALESYTNSSGLELEIGEIMIFSNHAYAELVESETGIGAMEVLIDPVSGYVTPEYGPNMMWNLKYGMHGGFGGGHGPGMMGGFNTQDYDPSEPMPVGAEEAVELAQTYLDQSNSGLTANEEVAPFYGYYTLHTLQDGQVVSMLSVNGHTGEVFLHTWHGDFIEMEHGHE